MSLGARNFFGHSKRRHCIAIDIGSNTAIRSLRFEEVEGEAVVAKKAHFELPFREAEHDLIPLISEQLRRFLFGYLKEIGHIPDGILIGLGNHFTFNEMAVVSEERAHPDATLSGNELHTILNKFLTDHKTKSVSDKTYVLAHLMPFRITIDGYMVDHLTRETRGHVVEMTLFATYVDVVFYKTLYDLKSILGGLELRFISDQAAVASALVSLMHIENALLVKIEAEATEVSLLGEGAIRFTGQFENGGNDITDAIAARLHVDRGDAERMKQQWDIAELPQATKDALNDTIRASVASWVDALTVLLKSEERFLIPERVFYMGGGARLHAIQDALDSFPWFNELTFLDHLEIRPLRAEDITSLVFKNIVSSLSGPEEVALAALAYRLTTHFLPPLVQK